MIDKNVSMMIVLLLFGIAQFTIHTQNINLTFLFVLSAPVLYEGTQSVVQITKNTAVKSRDM